MKDKTELIFIGVRTENYVRMACNAAMSFQKQGIPMTLILQHNHYEKHQILISKFFDNFVLVDEDMDPGYLKINIFQYATNPYVLFIDADSLAGISSNLMGCIEKFIASAIDFWIPAYSVVESEKGIWSHWGNYDRLKHFFDFKKDIANGIQSSCFFFNNESETAKELHAKANEVYQIIRENRKNILVNTWMKDFIPDELVWSVSTNLLEINPANFLQQLIRLQLVEHNKKIDKSYILNNSDIISFPCGKHRLSHVYKAFYNEVSFYHSKRNNRKLTYKYVDKV